MAFCGVTLVYYNSIRVARMISWKGGVQISSGGLMRNGRWGSVPPGAGDGTHANMLTKAAENIICNQRL